MKVHTPRPLHDTRSQPEFPAPKSGLSPWWITACFALALLPYLRLLLDGNSALLFRDITNLLLPVKATWLRGVRATGHIPLWDPFHGGGRPFLPDGFGLAPGLNGWAAPLVDAATELEPFILTFYPGAALAPPLLVLGPGWLRKAARTRRSLAFLALGATLTLLALGSFSPAPLYQAAIALLPLWKRFRYPERLIFWTSLTWIALSALAWERALRIRLYRPSRAILLLAGSWALLAGAFVACIGTRNSAGLGILHGSVFFLGAAAASRRRGAQRDPVPSSRNQGKPGLR